MMEPIDADSPIETVVTGQEIYCIVSYIANPAVTCHPGVFTYKVIGAFESCFSRNNNCAITVFATVESIASHRNTTLSSNSLEYISYALSQLGVLSITVGIRVLFISFFCQ